MNKQIAVVRQDTGDTVLVDDGDLQSIVKSENQKWLDQREQRLMYKTQKEYGYKDKYLRSYFAREDNILQEEIYSIRRKIREDAVTAGFIVGFAGTLIGFFIGGAATPYPYYSFSSQLVSGTIVASLFGSASYFLAHRIDTIRSLRKYGFNSFNDLTKYEKDMKAKYSAKI